MSETTITSSYQDASPDVDDFSPDFSDVLKVLISAIRLNALLISGIVLGVVLLGVVVTMLITPEYQAKAQILIEDQADQIIQGGDLQESVGVNGTERFLQTQLGIIQSRTLALTVAQSEKLDGNVAFFDAFGSGIPLETKAPGKTLKQVRLEKAANLLISGLEVEIPTDSRIATITITSRDPVLSARLANRYAERFIEYSLNQKYGSSSYAREFLSGRLADARAKLTQSERDLNAYARAAGLIRIGDASAGQQGETTLSVTNSQLLQLNNAAANATAERIAAEDRWNIIKDKPALAIPEVNSNSAVIQLITAKAKAESDLAEEMTQHLDGYATIKAKRAEVAELNRRINAITATIKDAESTNYLTARQKESSMLAQVASLRDESLKEQARGVQYSILKREADANRALYESLLSRYNQISASAGASSNNVTIVDGAIVPSEPSSPKLLLNIALAFILGLLLAGVIVALKELLDDAVRSPDDVQKKLGLPLLGLIPLLRRGEMAQELGDSRSNISEAYRSLVTNLNYSTSVGLPQVMAVTSSREGEGKSTASRTIAADIAVLGKKTLLVDADLRRPTLHRTLEAKGESGLTDYLIGQKSFDEIIHNSPETPLLSYITALPVPPDPSLILAGPGMKAFLEEARSRFDVVVLDCPPLLGLSDVPLLAQYTDGVLFVIDASSFYRGAVKSALRRLGLINVRLLGVALNRFSPKSGAVDYSYYNSYYSYGTETKKD